MQPFLTTAFLYSDSFLIQFYRITGYTLIDYLAGTLILAFFCVIAGELSISLALRFNRRYIDAMSNEMAQKERLSMEAYRLGDKESYKALNKEATDVWGKHFFTMIAYSAGILWPIPVAMGWMQYRFGAVSFDLIFPLNRLFTDGVSYTFTFVPLYILARIAFKYLRPRLPYFRGVQRMLNAS